MKITTAELLLAIFFVASVNAESVSTSMCLEGTVIGAATFRQRLKHVTKISLKEDAGNPTAESRRFCGDWEEQVNRLHGKHIRVNIYHKEYAPNECRKITSIELLN